MYPNNWRHPSGTNEVRSVRVGDGEYQREITPLVVVDQMRIGADQRCRNRVTARAEVHRKGHGVFYDLAGIKLLESLPGVKGVCSEHRLPQSVLDHVAEHQLGNRSVYRDPYTQFDGLT